MPVRLRLVLLIDVFDVYFNSKYQGYTAQCVFSSVGVPLYDLGMGLELVGLL